VQARRGGCRVLTTRHRLFDGTFTVREIEVRVRGEERTSYTVEWDSKDWDLALLNCGDFDVPPAPLGRLPSAPQPPAFRSAGFPAAGKQGDRTRAAVELSGRLYVGDPSSVTVQIGVDDPPSGVEDWAGASGSPVFVDGALVAVIREVPSTFDGRRINAIALERVLDKEPKLKALLTEARATGPANQIDFTGERARRLVSRLGRLVSHPGLKLIAMTVLTLVTAIAWPLLFPFPKWPTDGVWAGINLGQICGHILGMLLFFFWLATHAMRKVRADIVDNADNTLAFKRTSIELVQNFVFWMWLMYLLKMWVTCLPCSAEHVDADLACPGPGPYRWVRSAVVVPFVLGGYVLFRLHRHWSDYRMEEDGTSSARWVLYSFGLPFGAFVLRLVAAYHLPDERLPKIITIWYEATFAALLLAPADFFFFIGLVLVAGHLKRTERTPDTSSSIWVFIYAALQPVSSWALLYPQNAFWIGALSLFLKFILINSLGRTAMVRSPKFQGDVGSSKQRRRRKQ
jgi:hypothetical protein